MLSLILGHWQELWVKINYVEVNYASFLFTVSIFFLFRIGTEHEKFGFEVETLRPMKYEQIRDLLNGLAERFDWDKIMEGDYVIGLKQVNLIITLFLSLLYLHYHHYILLLFYVVIPLKICVSQLVLEKLVGSEIFWKSFPTNCSPSNLACGFLGN